MAERRDADADIANEETRASWQSEAGEARRGDEGHAPTDRRTADIAAATRVREPAETVPRDRAPGVDPYAGTTPMPGLRERSEPRVTQVWRGPMPQGGAAADKAERGVEAGRETAFDPPVGWLVIVDGPGRGHVATLGMGLNSIGRARTERVSLDYGDAMISRTNHGVITFDPRSRKFYVQHGGGTNLTYVNDEPVLAPRDLEPFTHLQMGETVLRFVPLCGPEFSWDDEPERG